MQSLPKVELQTLNELLPALNGDGYLTSLFEQIKAENEALFDYLIHYQIEIKDSEYTTAALLTYDLLRRQMEKDGKNMPTISNDTLESVIEILTTRPLDYQETLQRLQEENPLVFNVMPLVAEDMMGMAVIYASLSAQQQSNQLREELKGGS